MSKVKGQQNNTAENINEDKGDDCAVLEYSQRESKKKRRIRGLLLLLFNVLVIAIIIIVEVTSHSDIKPIGDVLKTWSKNWVYLLILFGIVAAIIVALGLRISVLIHALTGRKRLKLSFSTAVLGKYYDYVTPFGSGGQPFQMFNLGRKLDVGLATSIPITAYLVHEFVAVVIQIVIFCVNHSVMDGKEFWAVAAYLGLVVFAAAPVTVLLFSLFPRAISAIARFFCKVGHKLHLVKDVDKAEKKVIDGVSKYANSLKIIVKEWRALIVMIILSAVYSIGFNSIPYFVLKACGIDNITYFDMLTMSYYVYSAITIVPTPGGAGAAEGAFYGIVTSLEGPFRFWTLMLWRFCVYYLTLIIGFSVTVYQYVHAARKERKRAAMLRAQAEAGDISSPPELASLPESPPAEQDAPLPDNESELPPGEGGDGEEIPIEKLPSDESSIGESEEILPKENPLDVSYEPHLDIENENPPEYQQ